MNKEQFTNYLLNPENLNAASVDELTEIVSRFPYCQSAHILLTLNLSKEENILFQTSLRTTAVYAANRRILKEKIGQVERKLKMPSEVVVKEGDKTATAVIAEQSESSEPDGKIVNQETALPKTKQELLNEFIKNQPSISRGKESFFSATAAARKSIVDQENIVSETLAKIYFDQRYFDKAIKVYEKLSLKYPKKSIYFAALIEKAKNEVKS